MNMKYLISASISWPNEVVNSKSQKHLWCFRLYQARINHSGITSWSRSTGSFFCEKKIRTCKVLWTYPLLHEHLLVDMYLYIKCINLWAVLLIVKEIQCSLSNVFETLDSVCLDWWLSSTFGNRGKIRRVFGSFGVFASFREFSRVFTSFHVFLRVFASFREFFASFCEY